MNFECLLRGRSLIHVSYLFILRPLSIANLHNEALAKSGYEIKSLFCKDKLRNSTSLKFFACSSSSTSCRMWNSLKFFACSSSSTSITSCRMWAWPNLRMQFHVFKCSSKQTNVRTMEHSSQHYKVCSSCM